MSMPEVPKHSGDDHKGAHGEPLDPLITLQGASSSRISLDRHHSRGADPFAAGGLSDAFKLPGTEAVVAVPLPPAIAALPRLHYPATSDMPEDILPEGARVTDHNGLVIVSEPFGELPLSIYAKEDMPRDDDSLEKDRLRTIVPAVTWRANVAGALVRLAEETENDTAKSVIRTNERIQGVGSLAWKNLLANSQEGGANGLLIANGQDISVIESSVHGVQNRLLQKLHAQTTPEDTTRMFSDMDRFFTDAITDTEALRKMDAQPVVNEQAASQSTLRSTGVFEEEKNTPAGEKTLHEKVISGLITYADLLRHQTATMQIPVNRTVEAIAQLPDEAFTPDMLAFLTRFEIPPSLAGEILPKLEQQGKLRHPLTWHLLNILPDEHPYKKEQQERVAQLTVLLTGEITLQKREEAMVLADHIISVYPYPDTDPTRDKVGLEIENIPGSGGVSLPPGTAMGLDGDINSINELRLDELDEVLMYGREWRERYFSIHQWVETSQARTASLHVHINRNDRVDPAVYALLFGFNADQQVKESSLGTIEVKGTALAGYNNSIEEGGRGFSSEFMPELVELFYSLRTAELRQVSTESLEGDRFTLFVHVVEDPLARAAMLMALKTEAWLRVRDPKQLLESIRRPDSEIAKHIASFDRFIQDKIVTAMTPDPLAQPTIVQGVRHRNHEEKLGLEKLAGNAAFLSPENINRIIDYALTYKEEEAIIELASNFAFLTDEQQERVWRWTIGGQSPRASYQIGENFPFMTDAMKERYKQWVFATKDHSPVMHMIKYISHITLPEEQRSLLEAAQKTNNWKAISAIGTSYPFLAQAVQKEFNQWTFKNKSEDGLIALAANALSLSDKDFESTMTLSFQTESWDALRNIGEVFLQLPQSMQDKYMELTMLSGNEVAVEAFSDAFPALDQSMKETFITWVKSSKHPSGIELLTRHLPVIEDPSVVPWLVHEVKSTREIRALLSLVENITYLPASGLTREKGSASQTNLQVAVIDAVFLSDDPAAIAAIAMQFSGLSEEAKKRYIHYGDFSRDAIRRLALQFQTITDPDTRMWIVDRVVVDFRELRSLLTVLANFIVPSDSSLLKEKVVKAVIEHTKEMERFNPEMPQYNEGAILGLLRNGDSLDEASQNLFNTFINDNFPMLRKMQESNRRTWKYAAVH